MSWDPITGTFTPAGAGPQRLPGAAAPTQSGKYVTFQDLIDFGLVAGVATVASTATIRASISAILSDSAASIEARSSNLIRAMNDLAGVVIGSAGIAGYNSSGTATFTIDAGTGDVTLTGTVTASAGAIGGWTIGADYIRDAAAAVGMSSAVTAGDDVRFWAGHATPGSAPFRVTESGVLTATSANITGSITATTGTIGGFTIGTDYIRDTANSFGLASTVTGSDDVRFWAGDTFANRATAPMRITEAGAATFTNITVTGGQISASGDTTSGSNHAPIVATQTTNNPAYNGLIGINTGGLGSGVYGVNTAGGYGVTGITSTVAGVGVLGETAIAGGVGVTAYDALGTGTALAVLGTSTFTKQITSNLASGTAAFAVTSTTVNTNLNADMTDGYHAGNSASQLAINNGTLCATLYAAKSDILATARTIGNVSFDGSANIKPIQLHGQAGTSGSTNTSNTHMLYWNSGGTNYLEIWVDTTRVVNLQYNGAGSPATLVNN